MAAAKSKATQPLWQMTAKGPRKLEALKDDVRVDVCIVGAGIAGLSVAYQLGREGKKVVVLESRQLGDGETGHTTAHLSNALDDRFTKLESLFGEEGSRLAAESHGAAID